MGCISAADLMQETYRSVNAGLAQLDLRAEIRPCLPLPRGNFAHQTYLDNFVALEGVRCGTQPFEGSDGGPGDPVRAAGERPGVRYNEGAKRAVGATRRGRVP